MKNQVPLVMLEVGLKEKPNSFLPLEHKAGGEYKPVAVRQSLRNASTGPVGGQKDSPNCSANFTRTIEGLFVHDNAPNLEDESVSVSLMIKGGRFNERSDDDAIDQGPLKESADNLTYGKDFSMLLDSKTECKIRAQ